MTMTVPFDLPNDLERFHLPKAVAVGMTVLLAVQAWAAPPVFKLEIGPQTTRIEAQRLADGTVDYVAAFNQWGATGAGENAAEWLAKAVGPRGLSTRPKQYQRMLAALKLEGLPEEGLYIERLGAYLKRQGLPPEQATKLEERWDKIRTGPFKAAEQPELAAWIKTLEKPLELVVEGSKRTRCYLPLASDHEPAQMLDACVSGISAGLLLSGPLQTRAMLRLGAGDKPGAITDAVAMIRLGRLLGQRPILIATLSAFMPEVRGAEALRTIVENGALDGPACRKLLADLAQLPARNPAEAADDIGERYMALDMIMQCIRGDIAGPWQIYMADFSGATSVDYGDVSQTDWNVVLRRLNAQADRVVAAKRLPTYAARSGALQSMLAEADHAGIPLLPSAALFGDRGKHPGETGAETMTRLRREAAAYLKRRPGESVANYSERIAALLCRVSGSDEHFLKLITERQMQVPLARLMVALEALRVEKGAYPENLGKLVPEYVDALPQDTFSGQDFVYRRDGDGYVLYSVGPNSRDDGGKKDETADDFVVRRTGRR